MAFWKVAGFSQPSPIEQILDKEEYTLEELLDEDDIIQECKSLNGRLINFLREKKTVEQLLRYLIEPPNDPDDPKKQYRYPFTACEVFCCEVEAVFNTLLEDEELLALLFSLLDQDPPLQCKAAGYFGRVVGQLLLRKTNEMMQHLSNNDDILEKLIKHVDTTSIADIVKRLVGADDHSSMIFLPMHTQWLAETPLVDMLLDRLAPEYSAHVQGNAADILTAIAHTQPSALATQLMQQDALAALFNRALAPGSKVLVTALDVCAALLEPRRSQPDTSSPAGEGSTAGSGTAAKPHSEAITNMLQYVPQLLEHLKQPEEGSEQETQETPYGVLAPPLGRARLRIVELLAALLRVGGDVADTAFIDSSALPLVQALFVAFPFNNLLHHQMYALLVAALQRGSSQIVQHIFVDCKLVSWLASLPKEVSPKPRPGFEGKGALRAGYLGHVTRIGQLLQEASQQQQEVANVLKDSEWHSFVQQELSPRLELEDVMHWQCGRPVHTDGGELDSDGEDFQNDMDSLEQIQGMPPGMYHRYGVLDDMDDDDDEGATEHMGEFNGNNVYNADMLVAGMAGLGVNDVSEAAEQASSDDSASSQGVSGISNWSLLAHPGASSSAVDIPGERSMDDDAVLLADDEEMGALTASTLQGSPPAENAWPGGNATAASPPIDDMVMVEEEDVVCPAPAEDAAAAAETTADEGSASGEEASTAAGFAPAAVEAAGDAAAVSEAAADIRMSENPFAPSTSEIQQQGSQENSLPNAVAEQQEADSVPPAAPVGDIAAAAVAEGSRQEKGSLVPSTWQSHPVVVDDA